MAYLREGQSRSGVGARNCFANGRYINDNYEFSKGTSNILFGLKSAQQLLMIRKTPNTNKFSLSKRMIAICRNIIDRSRASQRSKAHLIRPKICSTAINYPKDLQYEPLFIFPPLKSYFCWQTYSCFFLSGSSEPPHITMEQGI